MDLVESNEPKGMLKEQVYLMKMATIIGTMLKLMGSSKNGILEEVKKTNIVSGFQNIYETFK